MSTVCKAVPHDVTLPRSLHLLLLLVLLLIIAHLLLCLDQLPIRGILERESSQALSVAQRLIDTALRVNHGGCIVHSFHGKKPAPRKSTLASTLRKKQGP